MSSSENVHPLVLTESLPSVNPVKLLGALRSLGFGRVVEPDEIANSRMHATNDSHCCPAFRAVHPPRARSPLTLPVPPFPPMHPCVTAHTVFFGLFVVLNNQLRGWYAMLAPSSVTSFLPGTYWAFPKSLRLFSHTQD